MNTGRLKAPGGEIALVSVPNTADISLVSGNVTGVQLQENGEINKVLLSPLLTNLPTNINGEVELFEVTIPNQAGTAQSGGNGGNIDINTKFIIAYPNENSNILANAFTGNGGNVNIKTQSLFGIEARPKLSNITNNITASSQFCVQGSVGIIQPEIQPTKTITALPVQVIDATTQLAQICPRNINDKPLGEFTITGRGSFPPSPLDPFSGTESLPLATLEQRATKKAQQASKLSSSERIIEAQGCVKIADGTIAFVEMAPTSTPSATRTSANCANISYKS